MKNNAKVSKKTCKKKTNKKNNNNNSSKKAYQLVKELTSSKQGRTTTIQDKAEKCLAEEQDILKRWTEYCSELYTHTRTRDLKVLDVPPLITNDYPIVRDEAEAAVKSLKKGKSQEWTTFQL